MLLALAATGTSLLQAGDWPQWRGAHRDGVDHDSPRLRDALPAGGLQPLWVSEPIKSQRDGGFGSPVIAGDRVYLFAHEREQLQELGPERYPYLAPEKRTGMTDAEFAEYERHRRDESEARASAYSFQEIVFCFAAATGETVWANRQPSVYSRWPQSGAPAIADGRLFLLAAARKMRCVDARTGDDLWERTLPGEFRDEYFQASPVVVDGVVVVMLDHLFALSASDGSIVWEGDPQSTSGSHSSPVVWETAGRRLLLVNLNGGQTACIDPADGEILWRVKTSAGQATPLVAGDRLITYGRSRKDGLRCFKLSLDGAVEQWVFQRVQDKGSSPVAVDGYVYVQGERQIACVDLETGTAAWQATINLPSPQYTSLIAADGKVFYAYEGLIAFAATPQAYTPLIEARFNGDGLMATEAAFRAKLNLDAIEREADGLERSLRLMQKETGGRGPLRTSSPAIADGRLYARTRDALVCYDLRAVD